MSCKQLVLGLICFIYFKSVGAQTTMDVEQIVESVAQNYSEDFDYSVLTDRLNFYQKNPININKVGKEHLQELFFLSPLQINALLNHRASSGPFINILELQSVEGFDSETIRKLAYFITLGQPKLFKDESMQHFFDNGNHDFMVRYGRVLENKKGFIGSDKSKSSYLGCPNRVSARYKFDSGANIAGALSMEKDAGEQFFAGENQSGFDFYSANITIKDWGKINKLIIGDYALQFGEGLTLWSGLSFGKGSQMVTLAKQDIGVKPYTSLNENSFFRGVAASLDFNSFRFSPFISYKKIDANLKDDKITSLLSSGLHRTPSEIVDKNSTTQFLFGSNLQYSKKLLTIGLTAYQSRYSHPFESEKQLYNQFGFTGTDLTNIGLNYHYSFRNSYFFGEMAHSVGSGYAFLNGLMSALSPRVSLSILHRNYQKNYHSFYNQAISEASTALNETGFYTGLSINPNSKWEWFGYVDLFKFPWLRFGVDAPSEGYELFSQLTYKPSKGVKLIARYQSETKEENDDLKNTINTLVQVQKQNYRIELGYQLNNDFLLRNRIELSHYQKATNAMDFGYLIYQDVVYSPLQSKFTGNIRVAYFDIPDYDARIYAYEHDVLYSYTVKMYQNNGFRYYVNGRYTIKRGVDFWLKYSVSQYLNQEKIGSGLDQIIGDTGSEIRLQLRYQF